MLTSPLLACFLALFLPGYALWTITCETEARMGLCEVIAIVGSSVVVSGTLAMILAEVGVYSWLGWASILSVFSIFLIWRGSRGGFAKLDRTSIRDILLLLLVIAVSAWELHRPFESIIGAQDTGVYFNTAVQIALHGTVVARDPVMASLNQTAFTSLYYQKCLCGSYGSVQEGFYIANPVQGLIVPQFFYLFPSLMAAFFSSNAPTTMLYFTPILSLISIVTLYVIVREMSGVWAAALSASLLGLNFAQIYFSRAPYSDILLQLLFLSAILAYIKIAKGEHSRFYVVVFGLAVGAMTITKLEGWLGAVVLLCVVALSFRDRILDRSFRPFVILLFFFGFLSGLSTWFFWNDYVYDVAIDLRAGMLRYGLGRVAEVGLFSFGMVLAFPVILLTSLSLSPLLSRICRKVLQRIPRGSRMSGGVLKLMIPLILITTALCYGYYLWPHGDITGSSWTLDKLGWYVGNFPGLAAGLVGLVIVGSKQWKRTRAALVLCLMFLGFYIVGTIYADVRVAVFFGPFQPWWVRRFVALVIPALTIGIGAIVSDISRIQIRKLRIGQPISIGVALLILLLTAQHLPLIQSYVEYDHVTQQVQRVASSIPSGSMILYPRECGNAVNSTVCEWIAAPLRFMYGMNPTPFSSVNSEVVRAADLWLAKGNHVYLLQALTDKSNYTSQFTCGFVVGKVTSFEINFVTISGPPGYFPTNSATFSVEYMLYELSPSQTQSCT